MKVEKAALVNNMQPKEYVDIAHKPFRQLLDRYNIKYSRFIRTTDADHANAAQHFWNTLMKNGFMYEAKYSGWYATADEAYYNEDEIADGRSIATGAEVKFLEEHCIFFKMSAIKNKLIAYYMENPDFILPKSRYNEALNILKSDIPDLAVSRSKFSWGVPVPGHDDQVMYVWFEALVNYLTVLGYPTNPDASRWWSSATHIVGKDILKFHAVYWPAMLLAADLMPPHQIYAHGWIKINDQKMSKSVGNVIDPVELADKFGVDGVRYFFARGVSYSEDSNFNYDLLKNTIETELVNELGNLVHRVLSMCCTRYKSTVAYADVSTAAHNRRDTCANSGRGNNVHTSNADSAHRCRHNMHRGYINNTVSSDTVCGKSNNKPDNHSEMHMVGAETGSCAANRVYSPCPDNANMANAVSCEGDSAAKDCLRAWDTALSKSKEYIDAMNVPAYVSALRDAVIETNRYINDVKPWSLTDPSASLGVLCLCLQRLFILYRPIIPTSIDAMMQNMNIRYDELQWSQHIAVPIQKPQIVFSRML
jgi:methionyl-tRNA synthetase